MKKQVTQRMRDERARRQAMGIALIQRPLRFIVGRHTPGSWRADFAKQCAKAGNGAAVQSIARSLA